MAHGKEILGKKVRETITGLRGTATAVTHWLNGCTRITIQPPLDKDGKHVDQLTFDEQQIEIEGEGVASGSAQAGIGGPTAEPRRASDPR